MADTTSAGVRHLHRSLPDDILIWEILARLPPKPLLRCRIVCRNWCRDTSTRDFLLAHHTCQPTLPLLWGYHGGDIDVFLFDHQAGVADDQIQHVTRLDNLLFYLEGSCDGLLILSKSNGRLSICNPSTRQYAPLQQLDDFILLGMYWHSPTGKYRILKKLWFRTGDQDGYYVFTVGSTDPSKHISCPDVWESIHVLAVLFHDSLHWYTGHMIKVFDTTAESFRQMRSPIVSGYANNFETGGMLGMSIYNEDMTTVDIWAMHDYQGEVWAFKHWVELPVAEITVQFGEFQEQWHVVVPSWDGDVFGLVKFGMVTYIHSN